MSKRSKERKAAAERETAVAAQQRQVTRQQTTESFSGPLPPPRMLAQYNEVLPDGAERIVRMVEKQSDHRMALEDKVISADITRANWGVAAGVLVVLAALAAAIGVVILGHPWPGAAIGGSSLATVAGVFVYGTSNRRAEREGRSQRIRGR